MKFLRHQVEPSSTKRLLMGTHNSALPMPLVVLGKLAALLRREKWRVIFMAGRKNVKALAGVEEQGKVRERLGAGCQHQSSKSWSCNLPPKLTLTPTPRNA